MYDQNCPSHQWLPVTPAILLQIRHILLLNPTDFDNIMLWAAFLLVCYFGLLRSGEITIPNAASYDPSTHLNFSDIAVDNSHSPNIMQVRIKASKTDPFCQGIPIGKTNNALCPVTALLNYLSVRGNTSGFLFHFRDHTPLTISHQSFATSLIMLDLTVPYMLVTALGWELQPWPLR